MKKPKIVCLCGSTRFMEAFQQANLRETLAGHIVLSVGCNTKSDVDLLAAGEMTEELKAQLDELHKRKIDLADEILVLNVGGYVGNSTRSEIKYALAAGKPVRLLEDQITAHYSSVEGSRESLEQCARMLTVYSGEMFPTNEKGQIHFARAVMESAASEILAFLSKAQ